jgi:hypothetical protein
MSARDRRAEALASSRQQLLIQWRAFNKVLAMLYGYPDSESLDYVINAIRRQRDEAAAAWGRQWSWQHRYACGKKEQP